MSIQEPMTLLTDVLLASLGALWGLQILRATTRRATTRRAARRWATALLVMAFGAVCGGVVHGFVEHLPAPLETALWKTTLLAVGLGSFLMLVGTLEATLDNAARRALRLLAWLKLLAYAAWMTRHDEFVFVIVDYGVGLLLILALLLWAWRTRPAARPAARWLVGGILIAFAAAGVQQSGLALHAHFNHNDLYHVIQMVATYAWYRGALRLEDRPTSVPDA